MKNLKIFLLFFNSILVFSLLTIGFYTQPYADLAPTILLLPVWAYFQLSLIHKMTVTNQFFASRAMRNCMRMLNMYSSFIVVLMIIASLLYSSTVVEATFTILFMPLLAYFIINLFDKKIVAQLKIQESITIEKLVRSEGKNDVSAHRKHTKTDPTTSNDIQELQANDVIHHHEPDNPIESAQMEVGNLVDQEENDAHINDQKRRQFLKIVTGGGISMFLMFFVFRQKAGAAFFGSGGGPGTVSIKDSNDTKIDPAEKQPTDGYTISEIDDSSIPSYYGFIHKNGNWYITRENSSGAFRYTKGASGFATGWTNRASLTYDYFDSIF